MLFQENSVGETVSEKEQGRGEYQNFPSNFFCLTLPKNFVGEPFSLSLISDIEKVYASEGYVTISAENFSSHSTKTFRSGNLM